MEDSPCRLEKIKRGNFTYRFLYVDRDVLSDGSSKKFGESIDIPNPSFFGIPLILNFNPEVRFDSSGLAMLLSLLDKNKTIDVAIRGQNESVKNLIRATGYDKNSRFKFYRSPDEAFEDHAIRYK